jgi:DNA-binding response OmpR family regulator
MSLDDFDESSPSKSGQRRRPLWVIVVDTRAARAEILSLHLMAAGHRCMATTDADVALAAVRERAPDLAVIDIDLTRGRGHELAQQIRMLTGSAVRLVGTTGNQDELERLLANDSVFDAAALRPLGISELLEELETARELRAGA